MVTVISEDELAAIEARANKATPGPWHWNTYRTVYVGDHEAASFDSDSLEDAEFIAHARSDVPRLVAEVRRLREIETDLRAHEAKRCGDHIARVEEQCEEQIRRAQAAEARVKELEGQLDASHIRARASEGQCKAFAQTLEEYKAQLHRMQVDRVADQGALAERDE